MDATARDIRARHRPNGAGVLVAPSAAMFARILNILNKRAVTIAGWSPGVRALLAGRVLPCGCLVGVYETWSRGRMAIVDGVDPACTDVEHAVNRVLWHDRAQGELASDLPG